MPKKFSNYRYHLQQPDNIYLTSCYACKSFTNFRKTTKINTLYKYCEQCRYNMYGKTIPESHLDHIQDKDKDLTQNRNYQPPLHIRDHSPDTYLGVELSGLRKYSLH